MSQHSVAYVPQYLQVASVLSFVLFNLIKEELMQRQLIGELNTQPTTHHVSLLEITPQRKHIWSWKPKTALTPDSILHFILSQWLEMHFYDWDAFYDTPHTSCAEEIAPKGILSKGPLKSYSCLIADFTLASRVGQLGRKIWPGHRYFPSISFGAMTPRQLLNQKFSKKLPRVLIMHGGANMIQCAQQFSCEDFTSWDKRETWHCDGVGK